MRLKLSNLACKSASASLGCTAAGAPSWATTGTFPVAAILIEPEAVGNPDNWSVSWRPNSSNTCDTIWSLK